VEKPDFYESDGGSHYHDDTDPYGGYYAGYPTQEDPVGYPSGPDGGPCSASVSPELAGMQLNEIEFVGYEAAATECADLPAGGGSIRRSASPCQAEQEADPGQCGYIAGVSEAPCDGDANLRDANWGAEPTGSGLLAPSYFRLKECFDTACGACEAESCAGTYEFTFDGGGSAPCSTFGPIKAAIWADENSTPVDCTSSEAECAPGSGRFALAPHRNGDRDGDSLLHVSYLPMQLTGTGVMTRFASVTSISKVSGSTAQLRVLRTRGAFGFTQQDLLTSGSSISTVISATHTFSSGSVSGNPVFVAEEVAESALDAYVVDMQWTCPAATGVTRPKGYQFRLSDIGCVGNQKMTLRYATSPKRVYLEQYGNSAFYLVEPTVSTTSGEAFVFEEGGLTIDGVLLSSNSNTAQVRLDEISWKGVSVCSPGTYTFVAE
jgi:hypothetical protein